MAGTFWIENLVTGIETVRKMKVVNDVIFHKHLYTMDSE